MSDPRIEAAIAAGKIPPDVPIPLLYDNRDSQGIIGIAVVTALASAVVISRLLSRAFVVKRWGADDTLVLLSLITFIPFVGLGVHLIKVGAGRRYAFRELVLNIDEFRRMQVVDTFAHLVYGTALVLCRVSGLAFYYRMCRLYTEFLITIKWVFGILIVGYVVQVCLIVFHCWPITAMWADAAEPNTPMSEDLRCLQWGEVYIANSVISLICDLVLFGIPVAMLQVLQNMPRKQKLPLAIVLLPGAIVIAISISRLALVRVANFETDLHWCYAFLSLIVVEVAEIAATLIALSLPGVKPLFDRFILRKDTSSEYTGSNRTSRGSNFSNSERGLTHFKTSSPSSMLSMESFGQYETEVTGGSHSGEKEDGIRVTVDVRVQDGEPRSKHHGKPSTGWF